MLSLKEKTTKHFPAFISAFVTMEYIQLCYFFILSKGPPLMFPFVGRLALSYW